MAAVVTTQSVAGVALTFNNSPDPGGAATATVERWPLTIDGASHELNVLILKPPSTLPVHGVVFDLHGISSTQSTLPPTALYDDTLVRRGYISVAVARRGNYGSTGFDRFGYTPEDQQLIADYQARKISYADLDLAAWRYQSNSMVAALQRAATHPDIAPHLHTILLIGASGGAPTAIQTSVDSAVFRAASKKAIVRVTGNDSALDTNPEATPGSYQYYERLAPSSVSSFWAGGLLDPLTSPGILACQFKFFAQAAPFPNSMILVPGWGHGSPRDLFSDQLYQHIQAYLVARGLPGF